MHPAPSYVIPRCVLDAAAAALCGGRILLQVAASLVVTGLVAASLVAAGLVAAGLVAAGPVR